MLNFQTIGDIKKTPVMVSPGFTCTRQQRKNTLLGRLLVESCKREIRVHSVHCKGEHHLSQAVIPGTSSPGNANDVVTFDAKASWM